MISCRPTLSDLCWRCRPRLLPCGRIDDDSRLTGIEPVADMNMRINGGYFILRQEIFDYLNPGDDLVTDAFARAAHAGKFRAVRFGFWAPMDTLKERAALEEMHRSGNRPWALWSVVG